MNKEKLTKTIEIEGFKIDWNGLISIDQIEKDLQIAKQLGTTHIDFDAINKYGDLEVRCTIVTGKQIGRAHV